AAVPPLRRRRGCPAALEKNLRARLKRLRQGRPGKEIEVWAEDACRLGLKPIARRVWSPRGHRPRSGGRTRDGRLFRDRLPPAPDRRDLRPAVAAGERGPDGRRSSGSGRPRRPGRAEGAGGAGGQRWLARGEAAGGAGERGPPLPTARDARVATGGAALAAAPGGGGEPVHRPDRPVARPHQSAPDVLGPTSGRRPAGRWVP